MKKRIKILTSSIVIGILFSVIYTSILPSVKNLPYTFDVLLNIFTWGFLYAFTISFSVSYYVQWLDEKYLWEKEYLRKLLYYILGTVFITMVLVVLLHTVQFLISGQNIRNLLNPKLFNQLYFWPLIWTFLLMIGYFIFYYIRDRIREKLKEKDKVVKTEVAKYETLKSQIDPHFLFNSLNVLTSLIAEDPEKAEDFTTKLSKVYRYVLEQKNKDLIPLSEELKFAKTYMDLLKMRFEDAVEYHFPEKLNNPELKVVPLTLQLLLENAVKHNEISTRRPLQIYIEEGDNVLKIWNIYIPKKTITQGTQVGLKNIKDRYSLVSNRKVDVIFSDEKFEVKVPLLDKKAEIMKRRMYTDDAYLRAQNKVKELKEFYTSLTSYVLIMPILYFINIKTFPYYEWFWFPLIIWGIGLIKRAAKIYGIIPSFDKDWEIRKTNEILKKEKNN